MNALLPFSNTMDIPQVRSLVLTVSSLIAAAELAKSGSRAKDSPSFNLFRFMRIKENDLSAIFSDLLDPRGTHGQGALFLDAFLARLGNAHWKRPAQTCHVRLEHQTDEMRRIDLTLTFPHGVIGIENKPWAIDQEKQLGHYATYLSQIKRSDDWNWLLVFISNRPPAAYSLSAHEQAKLLATKQFFHFSFAAVLTWLAECRQHCQSLKVNHFLDDLLHFIRTAINGEMEMAEQTEVVQTLMAQDNIEAAFVIAQSLDATKRALLDEFHLNLKTEADKLGYSVEWRMAEWRRGAGFYIRQCADDRLAVGFEFDANNLTFLVWGLTDTHREDDPQQLTEDSEIYRCAAVVMTNEFNNASQSRSWPWYSPPNDVSLRAELSHWDKVAAPWQMMASGELLSAVLEKAQQVFNAFNKQKKQHLLGTKNDLALDRCDPSHAQTTGI
jgi:hypothetical protein